MDPGLCPIQVRLVTDMADWSVRSLETFLQLGSVCQDECPTVCSWFVCRVAIGNRDQGHSYKDCALWSDTGICSVLFGRRIVPMVTLHVYRCSWERLSCWGTPLHI